MGRIFSGSFFKKFILIMSTTAVVVLNQACQSNSYRNSNRVEQDLKRISHARELLQNRYKKSYARSFEGDPRLIEYIEKYISTMNSDLDAEELTDTLLKVSFKHGYDPVFLLAVIKTESRFQPHLVGGHGEIGLMQIKPSTALWMAEKYNLKWKGPQALKDPVYNIEMGAQYMAYLRDRMESKHFKYINAYNMGPTNLNRLPASSQKKFPYVGKVMGHYRDIYSELKKFSKDI